MLDSRPGAFGVDAPLTLKLELLQVTGSFKPRGRVQPHAHGRRGARRRVAASGGNFGLAVGHAARTLGHRAEIFVPSTSPASKIDKVRATGADVRVIDGYYDDASAAAHERVRTRRARCGCIRSTNPRSWPARARSARSSTEQVPDADTVLVAVGGGGLIGGIASWFAGAARVSSGSSPRPRRVPARCARGG